MSHQDNDETVIAEVLKGNHEAFAVLVNKYKSGLYRLLLGMGANHQDAQDIAQDTFIKAYQKLRDHDEQSSFAAWLYAIAINRFKSLKRLKTFGYSGNTLMHVKDHVPTPEEQFMRKEDELEMQKRLSKLPERYKIVLLLRYTNELSYEEISNITGISMHQVKNQLFRARQKLKKQWPKSKEVSNEKMGLHQTR
jgi:RNA polymerase sigma factor (sigma-70 family)